MRRDSRPYIDAGSRRYRWPQARPPVERRRLVAQAKELLKAVRPFEPVAKKRPGWALEDLASKSERGRHALLHDACRRPQVAARRPRQAPEPRAPFTTTRLASALVQIARALASAHARGVVHRDVKPSNILVGDFGEVHLADWGTKGNVATASILLDNARAKEESIRSRIETQVTNEDGDKGERDMSTSCDSTVPPSGLLECKLAYELATPPRDGRHCLSPPMVPRLPTEVGAVSSTPKVSISVPDEALLQWAKERAEKTGLSLSAVFTGALRFERQLEARRLMLEEMGPEFRASPEEKAAIRAEWEGGPRWEPKAAPTKRAKKKTARAAPSKKRRVA